MMLGALSFWSWLRVAFRAFILCKAHLYTPNLNNTKEETK